MDTSDDPMTAALITTAVVGGIGAKQAHDNKPKAPDTLVAPGDFVDETAKHQAQGEAKKRKKMLAQSVITKDWDAPVLGNVGQL